MTVWMERREERGRGEEGRREEMMNKGRDREDTWIKRRLKVRRREGGGKDGEGEGDWAERMEEYL
eukprot:PDM72287.1 hypothetical protein PRIPAC_38721 [Pristionchus pacificus]